VACLEVSSLRKSAMPAAISVRPSGGVAVVETSVLWASTHYMRSDTGPVEVPDEFANSRDLFICLLHNLLLFDELRTSLDIGEEDDWYTTGVFEMVDQLKGAVAVTGMPPLEEKDVVLDSFAAAFSERLDHVAGRLGRRSKFPLPGFYQKRVIRPRSSDEQIFQRLQQTMAAGRSVGRSPNELMELGANGAFLFRGLRYAAHANFLANEGQSAVYSASPGRIVALARFLDSSEIVGIPFLQSHDYLLLIDGLGLPRSGYDWRFVKNTLRPIQPQSLTEGLLAMPPRQALERVLEIRGSPKGQRVRQIWAERLWQTGRSCLEGPVSLTVSNSQANSIVQIIGVVPNPVAELVARQEVTDSTVQGGITQHSDRAAFQRVAASEADELSQWIGRRLVGVKQPSDKRGVLQTAKSAFRAAFGSKEPAVPLLGTVKRFLADKGYGFVTPDDGTADVFVSRRVVQRAGLVGLKAGERVQMAVTKDDRGPRATTISVMARP
jgi:CspA family cold shock protein